MEAFPEQYLQPDIHFTQNDLVGEAQNLKKARQPNTAFAELYRMHVNRIYRYVAAQVGSSHDAQDITAQTFVSALEHLETYRSHASFVAWLFGIAPPQNR